MELTVNWAVLMLARCWGTAHTWRGPNIGELFNRGLPLLRARPLCQLLKLQETQTDFARDLLSVPINA
jgi:hypothetical protein